ncbi:AMP-dependent synthetase/ligase [Candidatus Magnetomonas plexicatena]|uniref:AMP-dependent synthetase/ligase n=1 Tax=Candidatus Magnetomonas plexicatena TaxID=2552947 RepID=UPI001C75B22B|nr:long-chain fatty acid--CoA ligase [Nitrospirales bacterium LBB_01]
MSNTRKYKSDAAILYERGRQTPDAPRFMSSDGFSGWTATTWGEFLKKSSALALYLKSIGAGPNVKVSIFAKNRIEWTFSLMAIHAARSVFVPVYHSNAPTEAGYIINHCDAHILITENDMLPVVSKILPDIPNVKHIIVMGTFVETNKEFESRAVYFEDALNAGFALLEQNPDGFKQLIDEFNIDDVAAILYTSGTTGRPKGVVLTHRNLYENAADWIDTLGPLIPEALVDLLWLPMSHIFGWGEYGLGNTLGFTTYLTTPAEVLKHMPEVRPTVFMSVPAYWEKLHLDSVNSSTDRNAQIDKLRELTGRKLGFCLSGGAGLKLEAKEFFLKAGMLIIEGYGLTECSPTLTMNRGDDFDFNAVGKAFPSVELKLAEDGEILAKGPNIFTQYYKDPLATKEAFTEDGWFKTGDLGEFNERGFLKIKGRKKEIIVTSGGKNISPQIIEARFKDDALIEHLVLYGNERKYLTALITLKEDAVKSHAAKLGINFSNYDELINHTSIRESVQESVDRVNKNLASFETIKKFYIHSGHLTVSDGFLTPSLKLKRNRVCDTFKELLDALYEEAT